jgi:hypothetical protein
MTYEPEILLLFYGLFNDGMSDSDYIALNYCVSK